MLKMITICKISKTTARTKQKEKKKALEKVLLSKNLNSNNKQKLYRKLIR